MPNSKYTKYIPTSLSEKLDELNIYKKNFNFYEKYHKNIYNKIVHIICIPNIVSSIFGLLNHLEHLLFTTSKNILSSGLFGTYILYMILLHRLLSREHSFFIFILLTTNHFYNEMDHKTSLRVFLHSDFVG